MAAVTRRVMDVQACLRRVAMMENFLVVKFLFDDARGGQEDMIRKGFNSPVDLWLVGCCHLLLLGIHEWEMGDDDNEEWFDRDVHGVVMMMMMLFLLVKSITLMYCGSGL